MGRRLIVHVGAHKTGSTFLQQTLLQSWQPLRSEAQVYVPTTGTANRRFPHQNLAWELSGDARFSREFGCFDDLRIELDGVGEDLLVLSSEDFNTSISDPDVVDFFARFGAEIGAAVEFVAVVREQTSQINSMYAQKVKMLLNGLSFAGYLNTQQAYAGLNYLDHYAAVSSDPRVKLRAILYSEVDRGNPLQTVLDAAAIDSRRVNFNLPSRQLLNPSPTPLQIAAGRLLTKLAATDRHYGSPQSTKLREEFERQVLSNRSTDDPAFWGWDGSAQQELAEKYFESNRRFASRFANAEWREDVKLEEPNELDLTDAGTRYRAWSLIDSMCPIT